MSLLERITRNIDTRYWNPGTDSFPVKNRYTAGVAGQRFFEELKNNGKIYGTYCERCGITYVPARIYCEQCFDRLDHWVNVGLEGTLFSFTVLYKKKNGEPKETPAIMAAVRIADGLLIHRIEGCSTEELWIGMPVSAELKPTAERKGSIEDITCFKPKQ
ncbi:MAG: Zn-ribbon domain-containing OB-fold protein [Bacillota bacterium]|nr:Zn-ribbon domain-containing OB-fold protein [Bacillota bacterium]